MTITAPQVPADQARKLIAATIVIFIGSMVCANVILSLRSANVSSPSFLPPGVAAHGQDSHGVASRS